MTLILSLALLGSLPVEAQRKSASSKHAAARAKALSALRVDPHFVTAKKLYNAGQLEACSLHLFDASAKMWTLAEGSDLPAAILMTRSAARLDALGELTAQGSVKDGSRLDRAFADAHHSMAVFQHANAEALSAQKKNLLAGRAMNRTADHVELAAKWSGQKLDPLQSGVVARLRNVAGGLIGGAGTVVEGTGSVLKMGVGLITKLGEAIKGKNQPPTGNLGKEAVQGTRKVTGGTVQGVGKVGESGAGAVENAGKGLRKLGKKTSGNVDPNAPKEEADPPPAKK